MKEAIIRYLSPTLKSIFSKTIDSTSLDLTEIRLRINQPLIAYNKSNEIYLSQMGLVDSIENSYIVTREDLLKTIEYISNFSLYAFENELRHGFITIAGGHRVGFCGSVVVENNNIKTMKNFNGINIRINHEILNASRDVIMYIRDGRDIHHTMIIAPPASGKTTLLRDIIREISTGNQRHRGVTVGVVDERSELAGSYLGVSQNNLGPRTDILDNCPKHIGMTMLLRSMAPKVIAVDELGKKEDVDALEDIINGGVKLICTVHGRNIEEIKNREDRLKIFDRYIVLADVGKIEGVYGKGFERIV